MKWAMYWTMLKSGTESEFKPSIFFIFCCHLLGSTSTMGIAFQQQPKQLQVYLYHFDLCGRWCWSVKWNSPSEAAGPATITMAPTRRGRRSATIVTLPIRFRGLKRKITYPLLTTHIFCFASHGTVSLHFTFFVSHPMEQSPYGLFFFVEFFFSHLFPSSQRKQSICFFSCSAGLAGFSSNV